MTLLLSPTRLFSKGLLACCLLILLAVTPALAGEKNHQPELRMGLLAHSLGPFSDGIESGSDFNLELLLSRNPQTHPVWGRMLFGANLNLNLDGDTSQFYVGRAWQFGLPLSFEIEYQFGGAIHTGELDSSNRQRRQLGTRFLFRNAFELGWRWREYRISAIYDHASNLGLFGVRNQGLDNVGIRLSVGL